MRTHRTYRNWIEKTADLLDNASLDDPQELDAWFQQIQDGGFSLEDAGNIYDEASLMSGWAMKH